MQPHIVLYLFRLWGGLVGLLLITGCDPQQGDAYTDRLVNSSTSNGQQYAEQEPEHKDFMDHGGYEVILLCGNNGETVSSLGNVIIQKKAFDPIIVDRKDHIIENKRYVCALGLSGYNKPDHHAIRQSERQLLACLQVDSIFRETGLYKIIFVVNVTKDGGVSVDDLVSINMICKAIDASFSYSIILNQVNGIDIDQVRLKKCLGAFYQQPLHIWTTSIKQDGSNQKQYVKSIDLTKVQIVGEEKLDLAELIKNLPISSIPHGCLKPIYRDKSNYQIQIEYIKQQLEKDELFYILQSEIDRNFNDAAKLYQQGGCGRVVEASPEYPLVLRDYCKNIKLKCGNKHRFFEVDTDGKVLIRNQVAYYYCMGCYHKSNKGKK